MLKPLTAALATTVRCGCASAEPRDDAPAEADARVTFTDDAYPSTYAPIAAPPVLRTGGAGIGAEVGG